MKFNPLFRCLACRDLISITDCIVDISDSKLNEDSYLVKTIKGEADSCYCYETSWILHKCKDGTIGKAKYAGFSTAE